MFRGHETLTGGYKSKDVWSMSNIMVYKEQNNKPANTCVKLILPLNMLILKNATKSAAKNEWPFILMAVSAFSLFLPCWIGLE